MKTLKIRLPFGRFFLYALLIALSFSLALELLARTSYITALRLPQAYGTSHPHFEPQLSRLKERIAQDGQIDCIFIGNSQVLYGIDPEVVEQTYLAETGRPIHCQNFGLGGLPPMTAGSLARVLIENFHPSLIVFGTGLWDYSSANAFSTDQSIVSSPWFQYQLGYPSLDGWLYTRSDAFRYLFGVDRALKTRDNKSDNINAYGHATYSDHTGLTVPEQVEYFETIAKRPELTETQTNGLRDLLTLSTAQTRILLVETPFDPTFLTINRKARLLYPDFKNMLTHQAEQAGVDLWMTQENIPFAQDEWYDLIHLNGAGAVHFSRLLGEYLAAVLPSQPQ